MTETTDAPAIREAVTLELEPEPINAPAPIPAAPPPAPVPAGGTESPLARIIELKRLGITNQELSEFLAMQRTWEEAEAKKAYHRAQAAWKAGGIPEIPKAMHVHYTPRSGGVVDYWHEDLADVVAATLPLMAAVGLTASWVPRQEGNGDSMLITVETVVTHTAGHSERVRLYAAPDASGGKNSIQAIKSTISYLERIGLLAILGIAAKGHDNDGRMHGDEPRAGDDPPPSSTPARAPGKPQTAPPEATSGPPRSDGVVSEKQAGLLVMRLRDKGIERADFCALYGLGDVEDLPRSRMDEALKWIAAQR